MRLEFCETLVYACIFFASLSSMDVIRSRFNTKANRCSKAREDDKGGRTVSVQSESTLSGKICDVGEGDSFSDDPNQCRLRGDDRGNFVQNQTSTFHKIWYMSSELRRYPLSTDKAKQTPEST
jgi:hypothetical protein